MKKRIFILFSMVFLVLLIGCDKKEEDSVEGSAQTTKTSSTFAEKIRSRKDKTELDREDLILRIKEVFDVSNDFDEAYTSEENSGNNRILNINWNNTNTGDTIYAQIEFWGNIISYNVYSNTVESSDGKFLKPNYDKTSAKEIADKALEKAVGENAKSFKYSSDLSTKMDRTGYLYVYERYVNNIPVKNSKIEISIDLVTGKIMSYRYVTNEDYDYGDTDLFDAPGTDIGMEKAKEVYKDNNKLLLNARRIYKYEDKSIYPKISYILTYETLGDEYAVNAVDGKAETLENRYYGYSGYGAEKAMMEDAAADVTLTQAEIDRLELIKNNVTLEEAQNKAIEMFDIGSSLKLISSRLSAYSPSKDEYSWELEFSDSKDAWMSIGLDAKDLSLISYYDSSGQYDGTATISEDEANKIAKAFLSKHSQNLLSDLELVKSSSNQDGAGRREVSYVRKLKDNMYILQDKISISVDAKSKKVVNFYKVWDNNYNEKFDSEKLSEDEIYEKIFEYFDFKKSYAPIFEENELVKYGLYYSNFTANNYETIVDAKTGGLLSYDGTPLSKDGEHAYEDLDKAENPDKIQKLLDYGVSYSEEKLDPTAKVKQMDVMKLLYQTEYYYRDINTVKEDELYEEMIRQNVLSKEEISKDKVVTRKEISKYLVNMSGLGAAGQLTDIYKDIYEDSKNTSTYKGYMTISSRLGFIDTEDDLLNPDGEVSREEALICVYNYLFRVEGK
ncbi:MAG: hypothetical protein GXZ08_01130 [Tissierellia bacterium]|nr:hypothetical protein [Tissierellia bacterium]